MSVLKRISGAFRSSKSNPPPEVKGEEPKTHRERLKLKAAAREDDITAQFATAFEALDNTASGGTELVKEICKGLTDESEKLKRSLSPPKKAHE